MVVLSCRLVGCVDRIFGSDNYLGRTVWEESAAVIIVPVVYNTLVGDAGLKNKGGHMIPDFLMLKKSGMQELKILLTCCVKFDIVCNYVSHNYVFKKNL